MADYDANGNLIIQDDPLQGGGSSATLQNLSNLIATGQANAAQMAAYQAVIQNLNNRFGDYSKLGPAGYKNISPQQLGASQLGNIQPDAAARGDEQAAIAQLGDIANSGGLELSDRNALNQLEQTQSRNNAARQNSLKNQFAARGQLGSGAELSMDLANNQNAAMNANQQGESIAAQAQQRAMKAVLDKAAASRSMGNDDYARKKAAAEANDSIDRFKATLATDAGKYNNTIAGQSFDDQLRKLAGENQVTGQLNTALLGQGQTKANGITGMGNIVGNGIIPGLAKLGKGYGSGGSGGPGDGNNNAGYGSNDNATTTQTQNDPANLPGGNPDTTDPTTFTDDTGTTWDAYSGDF